MSTATPRIEQPNIEVPLLRSAMYEMLMLAFAYPTVDVRERFNTLVEDIEEFEGTNRAGYLDEIRALRIAMSGTSTEALAAAHNHLFEQSSVCSPFETEYEADPFAKGRQLADIAGFYNAFGMTISASRPTMTDFLGTELEFMSLLSRKEAYAIARGWNKRREVTLDAERSFLRDHLGRWERAICGEISAHTEQDSGPAEDVYGLAARLATRFISDDVRRFQARPLRLTQRMLGNDEPLACPFAAPDDGDRPIVEDLAAELGIKVDPE